MYINIYIYIYIFHFLFSEIRKTRRAPTEMYLYMTRILTIPISANHHINRENGGEHQAQIQVNPV